MPLNGANFSGADLSVASICDAVIVSADFIGATVKRTDFDGAIVFGEDFLTRLAASVAPDTFPPELFTLRPVAPEDPGARMVVHNALTPEELATRFGGMTAFRITRIGAF